MNVSNVIWPQLVLTEEEARYCSHYATQPTPGHPALPGVLRRTYGVQLRLTSFPGEQPALTQRLATSGRRVRVFAVTFSGDIAYWNVRMSSVSGEKYIDDFTPVTALLNLAPLQGAAFAPEQSAGVPGLRFLTNAGDPFPFEPNIVLEGTQELVIDGTTRGKLVDNNNERSVLNMAFHVWEFPSMPRERGQIGRAPGAPPTKLPARESTKGMG